MRGSEDNRRSSGHDAPPNSTLCWNVLAAAVVSGTGGIVSGVAGVRRWRGQTGLQLEDRFHIASCTKSWTVTLAAIAVQRGQLRWTTTLAEGLPTLATRMRREYASATLEQLLAHEARLPAYTQPSERRVEEMLALTGTSTEQRLAFLAQVLTEDLNHATGDGAYSNAGYTAVGALLEWATGSPWEVLIRRKLAQPLGLTTVGFGYDLRVIVVTRGDEELLGLRLVAVGEHAIAQVLDRIKPVIGDDFGNPYEILHSGPGFVTIPEVLYGLGLAQPNQPIPYVFETDDGQRVTKTFTAVPLRDAAQLKHGCDAVFVGEVPRAVPNRQADIGTFTLPNSRFEVT